MLKPATIDDVPGIVAMINRAYRGGTGWSTEAAFLSGTRTTEALLRADLRAKPEAALMKWQDARSGRFAGCVWLEPLGGEIWYLGSLTIDPARQNGGNGGALLQAAEQWIGARGGRRVRMTVVNVRDALIAWYERRGYALTGDVEPFPYGDDRFGTPLRDDLAFVVLEKVLPAAPAEGRP